MKTSFKYIILIVISILLITSCGKHDSRSNNKLLVAVSIVPQETFIKKVAGDLVDVVTLIPPGKSPANYAPSPQELEKLSASSLYFTMGVEAEQNSILPKLKDINKDIEIISMADKVKRDYPEREFSPGQRDPHIWLSPKRAILMVEIIARELSGMDEENHGLYVENARAYMKELTELDREIADSLYGLNNKSFIIYHPSLGYFADDYGLNMIAIQSEGKDAPPNQLQEIIDMAKIQDIKTIFYQAEIDSRQSKAIASEIRGDTVQIDPLSPDYINNLKEITNNIIGAIQK